MKTRIGIAGLCLWAFATANHAVGQEQENAEQRVAAIKTSLAESQKKIRAYEWVETTVVSLKGEEKSRHQNSCYYGKDNVLQKVPIGAAPEPEKKSRGLRGKMAEHKKEELTEEMQAAVKLVHQYVPPDTQKLRAAQAAGRISLQPMKAEGRGRVTIADYLKKGDSLGLEVDLATNRIVGVKVSTYLDSPDKPITLDVVYSVLEDGTSYVSKSVLDDVGEKLQVTVQNTGYKKKEQAEEQG